MRKLNNKGMTIVEILVCFMIVAFISTALFSTATVFNNKRSIESTKAELIQYRNQIDKLIEDDLINKGLSNAKIITNGDPTANSADYEIRLFFRDGTEKTLKIHSKISGEIGTGTCNGTDSFYVEYGGTRYTLPDVGSSDDGKCKDLRYGTIKVSNEENVLLIYINFTHPELGNDYAINIVAPINYFG